MEPSTISSMLTTILGALENRPLVEGLICLNTFQDNIWNLSSQSTVYLWTSGGGKASSFVLGQNDLSIVSGSLLSGTVKPVTACHNPH
jgi:hypothetical protein